MIVVLFFSPTGSEVVIKNKSIKMCEPVVIGILPKTNTWELRTSVITGLETLSASGGCQLSWMEIYQQPRHTQSVCTLTVMGFIIDLEH